MSDIASSSGPATENPTDKGKGKAIATEEEESDSSDDEMGQTEPEEEDPDVEDDDLAALDSSNIIITGGRTRGKQIDFAKAAAEQPADEDDDEDEEYAPAEETAQRGPGSDGMDIDS